MAKHHSSQHRAMAENEESNGWAEVLVLIIALACFLLILGVGLLSWLANLWIYRS